MNNNKHAIMTLAAAMVSLNKVPNFILNDREVNRNEHRPKKGKRKNNGKTG